MSNVVRGGASAVVALILPHFLTRDLSVAKYAAWILMLQIAAYSNYLDFGLQTAVARYVAQAVERRDDGHRDRIISTTFILLSIAGLLALVIAVVIVFNMRRLFHSAPLGIIGELQNGALLLSASAAALLPLSTFTGVLVGLQSNEYPALAIGGTRLLGAAGVLILVRYTHSLAWLALCIAGFNFLGGILQYVFCRKLLPTMHIRLHEVTRKIVKELVHYCAGLTAFSVGMLLVGGLDVVIVGYFAFNASGYYAIAATVISFMVGMSGAVYTALMAPMAVMQERREYPRIRSLVLKTTRTGSYASLSLVILIILAGRPLLTLWVGPVYATHALPFLEILLWAQAIRLTGVAYSVALVATAQQNYGIAAALAEGITNLFASIIGAYYLGPIGVAWGTFVGSIVGVLWLTLHVMRRVREVPVSGLTFGKEAFLWPIICFLPLILYTTLRMPLHLRWDSLVAATLLCVLLLYRVGGLPRLSITAGKIRISLS